ncbi:MAG TPA: phospholipase D-like domain-containing protein [Steroidobacteraceae bacterium]
MTLPAAALAPFVVSSVHVLLASAVSVHVLLNKRDVGSSVGWIGLAWLTPLLGSALYLLLGINRVRRRAKGLRRPPYAGHLPPAPAGSARDDHLAALERAGGRITGRAAQAGNSVRILHNGDAAYPQMLAAIDAAQCSVGLSSYIFRADAAGDPFIEALTRAAQRGVQVRVLIDGIGGGYFLSATYRRLRRARVPVARFLHSSLPWRMPFLNLRSHKKILAIDGRVVFTGGLNIGAENLTRLRPRRPVFDTHFRLEGPVVAQLVDVFVADWQFASAERLASEHWFPRLPPAGESIARAVVSGPDQDLEKIEFLILEAVGCARTSIKLMTPYFLPDERLITALALASYRGVEVDVILPEHSNHPTLDWASRMQSTPLLAAGCRIWMHPPPFNHSKLMSVDGIWALIGSANWDVRSFRLNFELDLEIYHSDLVRELDALMAAQQGTRLDARDLGGPLLRRLRNSAARLMLPYL